MTTELVKTNDFTMQLAELDKIQDTCKKLLSTKHYQALGEAGIHAIMARSKALGIHPFEALNGGFHCINGKVGMSTEMMAALVRQRGHSIQKDARSTSECIILHGKRADNGDTWTCHFTKDDAIAAGLWNSATWKKYPTIMLYNRCMSMLFRQLFPDLSLGAGYVEDELKEIAKVGDYQTIDVTPRQEEPKLYIQDSLHKPTDSLHKEYSYLHNELNGNFVQLISAEQAVELKELHDKCDSKFKERVLKTLSDLSVKGWSKVPSTMFDSLKQAAIANHEQYKKEVEAEISMTTGEAL